jgi:hypothetical protein
VLSLSDLVLTTSVVHKLSMCRTALITGYSLGEGSLGRNGRSWCLTTTSNQCYVLLHGTYGALSGKHVVAAHLSQKFHGLSPSSNLLSQVLHVLG